MRRLLALLLLLAASPAVAATLIVGNKAEDTVSLIDLATGREARRIPTGANPHEVAVSPDGRRAAVVAYGGVTIDILDIARGERVRRIDLSPNSRPHGIVWLADGRLVVTTEGSGTLTVASPEGGVLSAIPTGRKGSHMVAVAPDGAIAYVSNLGDQTVSVIDLRAGRKLRDLDAGPEPEGIALSPDGRELWVASRKGPVSVFDTRDFARLAVVETGGAPYRLAISPDGRTAITSNFGGGDLTVIDRAERKVARVITVSGDPRAQQVTILFSRDGRRLFVAETALAQVAEVDLESGRVLRRLTAGKGSDGLGFSPLTVGADDGAAAR